MADQATVCACVDDDDLAPARGVIFGIILSAAGWGVLVGFCAVAFVR